LEESVSKLMGGNADGVNGRGVSDRGTGETDAVTVETDEGLLKDGEESRRSTPAAVRVALADF
jgi:hypothetical protein